MKNAIFELQEKPETIVASLEQSQQLFFKYAGTIRITTQDEQHNAEDLLIHARQSLKDAETKRKKLLVPINEARDRINKFFAPYTDKLSMAIQVVNTELQRYHTELTREAERARLLALAEQATRMAEAEETGEIIAVQTSENIPDAPAKTSQANLGSVTYREVIEVIIVNAALVPRDLCDPNLSRIRARAQSGVTEIPGVLITKKFITVARGSK